MMRKKNAKQAACPKRIETQINLTGETGFACYSQKLSIKYAKAQTWR